MKLLNTLIAAFLVFLPLTATAEDAQTTPAAQASPTAAGPTADVVTIRMKDGGTLLARIIDQNEDRLSIVTAGGLAMEIPRTSVASIDTKESAEGTARLSDSNATRLLFSPTGRPLPKGEGYFSDHFLVFPGVAYGITDHLSIGAGASVVPGLGLSEQAFYVAPKYGRQFSERFAASGGLLYAHAGDSGGDGGLGLGFAIATLGKPDKSLTVGVGVARTIEHRSSGQYVNGAWRYETRRNVAHTPVVILGGTARLSRRIALVSENWLVLNDDFKLEDQPFAVGVRFFGDRLSADVGVVLVGDVIEEGFPIPWLSVSYHFGRPK